MRKKVPLFISFLMLVSFLSFLSVKESFSLALGGDDWGIHWLIWGIFDVWKEAVYYNPLTYFCTYCPHYFFLSIISRFFGYEPFYYFLANFLARVTAAIGLYFFVRYTTKKTLPAVLASSFFAVTYLGIEATDWAFNYNHILGVALVAIFLICYYKAKATLNFKHTIISASLFAVAAIVSPPRMHGLLPLLIVVELGWWLIEGKKFNFKQAGLRLFVMFLANYAVVYGVSDLYFFIKANFNFEIGPYFIGNGYAAHGWNEGRVRDGIKLMLTWLSQGRSDFIIDPIATLGNFIFPDRLWQLFPHILPISIIFGALTFSVLFIAGIKKKWATLYIFSILLWILFIYFLRQANVNTFSQNRVAFAIVGGHTTIFSIWLFFLLRKTRPVVAHLVLLSLGWMNTFTIFPYLIEPVGLILSWHRYAIQQAAGLSVWMATIAFICIELLKSRRKFVLLGFTYFIVFLFIFMHIKFSNDYLGHVATYRNRELDTKYWSFITNQVTSLDKGGSNIFLLLTNLESAEIAEAIRFGFGTRAAIYYHIEKKGNNPVMVVNNYTSVLGDAYDGRNLVKHGHEFAAVPLSRIYAFALQNKEIYNITDQVRVKLTGDLEALNIGTLTLPQ